MGLIVSVFAVAGAGAYAWFTLERPPALDRASLCPVDGPRSITVVLLDVSDDLPEVAKREVAKLLTDTAETLPEYGLIELRLLDPAVPSGRTIFAKCNPGDGSDRSELTSNPAKARKIWLEGFRKPISEALTTGLKPSQAKSSPIMSTIQSISVDRFTGQTVAPLPKRLVVVSDMIEHGPEYSQYGGDLTYDRFKASPLYRRVRTDLRGSDVTIYYVQRITSKPLNSVEHIRFWTEWMRDNNGRLREATKLQGIM